MSDFPTFPLLSAVMKKTLIPPETRICQSISHVEARDAWGSAFRRRWTISIAALRQKGALTELATLQTFYVTTTSGMLNTFTFLDPGGETGPETGGKFKCRFENETLEIDRLVTGYWPVRSISFIQVL